MALIPDDREIVEAVAEQILRLAPDLEPRERQRLPGELRANLLEMVEIEVTVATRPDEFADAEVALLRDHVRQERVGRDVERHSEEQIRAPLVQLARELAVDDVELEQRVAGCERHPRD